MTPFSPLSVATWAWVAWFTCWFALAVFAKRSKWSEGALARLQHVLPMAAGFLLIFHDRDHPLFWGRLYDHPAARWAGTALALLGLLFAVWARLHLGRNWSGVITLKEGHRLVRSGPYRVLRHPLYTGFLSAILGTALAAATGDAFLGFAAILVAFLFTLRREEALLTREFGDEYVQFRRDTAALVPGVF
jgi:protein-S-isoprenylcysteine O-methyltransferase Ste14